ncbi:MAG TPA: helix-turn-helix transcriptional regulator [Acidimicrobiales bacterium]|nr:helix-turn-helix transcriptional regulator [Acidimicrobiales bacterium]
MTTVTAPPPASVGVLLRDWRQRRRLSQLDLAMEAEVSARHLSFVETGRAKPSRELVLHLAGHLEVPLRERNTLLLAAGYAPVYQQTQLDDAAMGPVRAALDRIVGAHQPFPAVVVDRRWDLVTANAAALEILTDGVAPALLAPPPNALRVSLHPDGLAGRIENLEEWAQHLLERLDRQVATSGARDLRDLARELRSYPNMASLARPGAEGGVVQTGELAERLFVPLVLRHRGRRLRLFSTVATFGTALDITIAELAIESFFPADAETAAALEGGRAPG